jgi:hypothetical protein
LVVGIWRPNDQRLTPTVRQIPVTVRIAPGLASVKRHAAALVCVEGDPFVHESVPTVPGMISHADGVL